MSCELRKAKYLERCEVLFKSDVCEFVCLCVGGGWGLWIFGCLLFFVCLSSIFSIFLSFFPFLLILSITLLTHSNKMLGKPTIQSDLVGDQDNGIKP